MHEEQIFGLSSTVRDDVFGRTPRAEKAFMEIIAMRQSARRKREITKRFEFTCDFLQSTGLDVIVLRESRLRSMSTQDVLECLDKIVFSKSDQFWSELIQYQNLTVKQRKKIIKYHAM